RANQEVRRLVLIDSFVPRWSRYMRNEVVNFWNRQVRPHLDRARSDGLMESAREWRRRRANPSPAEEMGYRQMRVMRTYLARLTAYAPRPYSGHVVLLRAAGSDIEAQKRWTSIATGPFEMHEIPGDHYTHLREYARATAARLEECLDVDEMH